MRINARAPMALNPHHAFMTPPEAVTALMEIEDLPNSIFDPCCGDGALLEVLRGSGRRVYGSDIQDYGWPETRVQNYLEATAIMAKDEGIVTNPPYHLAESFIRKAIGDGAQYHAWLLRTNFLESTRRMDLWRNHPPARIWISSRRLPMMHRYGYKGPKASSNVSYMWLIFEAGFKKRPTVQWFDWRNI